MVKKINELTPEQQARVNDPANLKLVKQIAYHLIGKYPPNVEVEDLMQAGFIGLVDAAEKYDSSKGAQFKVYAGIRIKGAMIDLARESDWGSRSIHRIAREAERILSEDQNRQEGFNLPMTRHTAYEKATKEILAGSINTRERQKTVLGALQGGKLYSLDVAMHEEGPEPSHGIWSDNPTPSEIMERDQEENRVTQAIQNLPPRIKEVVEQHADGKKLQEIADQQGLTESRICQLRKKGVGILRHALRVEDDGEPLQHSR